MGTFKSALPAILAGTVVTLLSAASAHAQATRTWVSGVGDDVNPCSRTAPCKTFAGAISKTAVNGEINCLDPGGFGTLTVTKSITVDCHEVFASALNSGVTAFTINFDSFGADVRKTVNLRNIQMQGADLGTNGVRIVGGATIAGGVVVIEDCLINGNFGGTARGISDERISGGELFVINTTVRNNGGSGIAIVPASGSTGSTASITNVRALNNSIAGLVVGGGGKAMVKKSVFAGNSTNGVDVEGGSEVNVDDSVMSGNGVGLFTSAATLRVSNSDIALNTTAAAAGPWTSFGNNRVSGNPGTAPTAAGGPSSDLGQK
jgi:hypothetical protein